MKLEEMSGEKLLDALCSACNDYIAGVKYSPEYQKLLSRLTRGEKAIKAMEKIDKIYINHRAYDEYVDSVRSIIEQYRGKDGFI